MHFMALDNGFERLVSSLRPQTACIPVSVTSQSCVDASFWSELGEQKLHTLKLSEAPVSTTGMFHHELRP
jgi:hypothetical protein